MIHEISVKATKARAMQLYTFDEVPHGVDTKFERGDYLIETACGVRAIIPQEFFKKFFQITEIKKEENA